MTEFDRAMRDLRYEFEGDLRRFEDELRGEVESARSELRNFAGDWSSAHELHEALDERCDQIDTTAKDALRQAQHTAAWLARYSRPGGPRTVVDPTDRPATALLALALKADEAGHLSEQLLPSHARTARQTDLARLKDWQHSRAAAAAAAIKASTTLAATDTEDPEHVAAEAAFTRAQGELDRLDRIRDRVEDQARSARSTLAADDAARAEHEYSIADGVQGGVDLRAAIEQQILDAREADALFAPWFTGCFGFNPESPDLLELAVEVCAYRITYNISSEKPLGAPPESDCSATRRDWYGGLLRQLVDYDAI